jgi:LAS superfamily LD-carboxypeptidase LdcB
MLRPVMPHLDDTGFRPLDAQELTGRARTHLLQLESPRCLLHVAVAGPFLALRAAAALEGIDLMPASSFRDFDRQCLIWNEKFRGDRPLLDRAGRELLAASLPIAERIEAILAWSALPGASRHHWGTDLDVYDAAALPADGRPRLVPEEYREGGPFAQLDAWLACHAARFGFFRPYASERGGVAPEPWHISHARVAEDCLARLDAAVLREALSSVRLEGAVEIDRCIEDWHARFVRAVDAAPTTALTASLSAVSARELGDDGCMV